MTYEEFQSLARLFTVGWLEKDEMERFRLGRKEFGQQAEDFIVECRKLNLVFALSLRPMAPTASSKKRLMEKVRESLRELPNGAFPETPAYSVADRGSQFGAGVIGRN